MRVRRMLEGDVKMHGCRFNTWNRGDCGFTLVELLVVIAIILMLMGLVVPGLQRARGSADHVGCASNLRRMAMAGTEWMRDNNLLLPDNNRWRSSPLGSDSMTGYFGLSADHDLLADHPTILTCPAMARFIRGTDTGWWRTIQNRADWRRLYNMNTYIARQRQGVPRGSIQYLHQLPNPAVKSFFMDGRRGNNTSPRPSIHTAGRQPWYRPHPMSAMSFSHNGRMGVVFADGHVQQIEQANLPDANSHPFWSGLGVASE